ncbi:uncharacterized protein LOC129602516 [Paramacrobiotus metropolitanus]|uniref:uncharacterized protein LOC129602516 n=1 Tax=Paramacrobiotus metropolitanus TaxID=2943436 RepID=UPI0024463775|nr:uncharacterized protein LOC129602516 [Paramacrobiotus metropolitanus]
MYPSEIRKSAFLLVSIVAVISCITASTVDVALVQFYLWGDKTPTSVQFVGPVRAKAVEDLAPYKDVLNITTVFVYERNVTTCDAMDERVTYWFASYYYRFRMGNPIMSLWSWVPNSSSICGSTGGSKT